MAEKKPVKKRITKQKQKDPTWDEIGESIGKKIENWDCNHEDNFKCKIKKNMHGNETGGIFYFLGFVGALIYYGTTAVNFWGAVVGFLKAIVWPAFLVYGVFKFIGL